MVGLCVFFRGIAQLVERRSPKPNVVSSNLTAPANKKVRFMRAFLLAFRGVDENSRGSEFEPQLAGGLENAGCEG